MAGFVQMHVPVVARQSILFMSWITTVLLKQFHRLGIAFNDPEFMPVFIASIVNRNLVLWVDHKTVPDEKIVQVVDCDFKRIGRNVLAVKLNTFWFHLFHFQTSFVENVG